MAVGSCIITNAGLAKFAAAGITGTSLVPKFYRVTGQDLPLDPALSLLEGWREAEISAYLPIEDNITEFTIDIPPDGAADFGTTFGLFLDDNTLFLLAKPPYPLPPGLRHIFKIQLVYQNAVKLMDFHYLPTGELEQNLAVMQNLSTLYEAYYELSAQIALIREKMLHLFDLRTKTSALLDVYLRPQIDAKIQALYSHVDEKTKRKLGLSEPEIIYENGACVINTVYQSPEFDMYQLSNLYIFMGIPSYIAQVKPDYLNLYLNGTLFQALYVPQTGGFPIFPANYSYNRFFYFEKPVKMQIRCRMLQLMTGETNYLFKVYKYTITYDQPKW